VHAGEPYGNATCYDRLSIVTARVYWTTSWSPTKCHNKTERNQTNSHRHGTYLLVSIKCFAHCLKMLFHFNKSGVVEVLCILGKALTASPRKQYTVMNYPVTKSINKVWAVSCFTSCHRHAFSHNTGIVQHICFVYTRHFEGTRVWP
jgi:hypothetical protein